jgi:transcriptional regulator with XRE-family HTH domain
MINDIDLHVGRRIRRRRRLLGLTQQDVGKAVGCRFQQIQKYECGANRVTAARLYQISIALRVQATFFFEGLPDANASSPSNDVGLIANDVLCRRETIELVRAYYMLDERPRRRLLDLARALHAQNVA